MQTCRLGAFRLESGDSIADLVVTFVTLGSRNEAGNNAILSLHGLRGDHNTQTVWAGPGKAFDTDTYWVVQPDTLGMARSTNSNATSSPTRSGLDMAFPRFSIGDMVNAEYRLLTECLNLTHLVAVSGTSMGAAETLQWAVSYPSFMDAVIPILPQARSSKQSVFVWEAARQAIMLDPNWRDGHYPVSAPPRQGVAVGLNIQTAFGSSAAMFDSELANVAAVLGRYASEARNTEHIDARDWIYRTWALEGHDIAKGPRFGDSLAAAAHEIRARTLIVVNCFDQLLSPREGGVFELAREIDTVKLVNLNHPGGHGGAVAAHAVITSEVHSLFERIRAGQAGFGGPHFPPGFERPGYCSPLEP